MALPLEAIINIPTSAPNMVPMPITSPAACAESTAATANVINTITEIRNFVSAT